jgi:nucleoside-diphosphate-sugar epimerase
MKVFVSGASGFLGSAVTTELARRGHEVTGLTRDEQGAKTVKNAGGKPIIGDLFKGGAWCDAIKNVDKVISLTQPISIEEKVDLSKIAEYSHKHTESVTNLIKAAADGKAKAVIVSYHTLCFGDRMGKWVNDFDFVNPVGFCRPLAGSFEAVERVGEDAGLPLINIFPGMVYGNGSWLKMIIDSFQKNTAKVVEPGNNYLSLIHVEDAATLYALAAEKLGKSENFTLADDRPVTQRVLMDHIADMLDQSPVPMVDFNTYAKLYGKLMAETMSSSIRVQGIRAMDLLGHIPKLRSYEAGIRYTLKSMGIEPRKKELEEAA